MPEDTTDVLVLLAVNMLGGAELSLIAIARGLKQAGFSVTVALYGRKRKAFAEALADMDTEVLDADGGISALLPLTILLGDKRPKILLSALRFTNAIGLMASRWSKSGTRTIITEHTPLEAQSSSAKDRFIRKLMDTLYPRADAVVAVSQGIAEKLGPMLEPKQAEVIYNPIVKGRVAPLPPAHAWLNPGSPPVVMGVGRLSGEKNFALLLRAFAQASLSRPMHLIILGEGDERKALEALAKELGITERVLLPGFVDDIAAWLPHAKVFASSSQYEGFGNAIVEAMHYRVPVVAADCPVGPREILEGSRFGTLVPSGNEKALAAAILAAIDAPGDTNTAFERAQQFTGERCIAAYAALIRRLAPS